MTRGEGKGNRIEEHRGAAVQVALRTGLLKKCPVHGEVYDPGQHDYQGACMVATYLINRSDPIVAPFQDDRAPLLTLLKSLCPSFATSCSGCAGPVVDPVR